MSGLGKVSTALHSLFPTWLQWIHFPFLLSPVNLVLWTGYSAPVASCGLLGTGCDSQVWWQYGNHKRTIGTYWSSCWHSCHVSYFSMAMTNTQPKPLKERRACVGSHFEGTAHHDGEKEVAGAGGHVVSSVKKQKLGPGSLSPFLSVGTSACVAAQLAFRVGPPPLLNWSGSSLRNKPGASVS